MYSRGEMGACFNFGAEMWQLYLHRIHCADIIQASEKWVCRREGSIFKLVSAIAINLCGLRGSFLPLHGA